MVGIPLLLVVLGVSKSWEVYFSSPVKGLTATPYIAEMCCCCYAYECLVEEFVCKVRHPWLIFRTLSDINWACH